jgi:histone-lysine N-methyltransferase SUV420H
MAPKIQEKKGGLTLEKLASYDDVITDALVDKVGYITSALSTEGRMYNAQHLD